MTTERAQEENVRLIKRVMDTQPNLVFFDLTYGFTREKMLQKEWERFQAFFKSYQSDYYISYQVICPRATLRFPQPRKRIFASCLRYEPINVRIQLQGAEYIF